MKAHPPGLVAATLLAAFAFAPLGRAQTTAAPTNSPGTTTGTTTNGDTAAGGTASGGGMAGNSGTSAVTPGTTVGGPTPGGAASTAAISTDHNPAVSTSSAMATQPAKGANSFTRGEARRRFARHGYTDVSDLKKDANGVWTANAKKDGAPVSAWLDYKGNVGTH